MFQFLEKVRGAHQAAEVNHALSFKKLAIKVANGQEPKTETVLEVLRDSGKTPNDLEAAAQLIAKRRKLKETYDAAQDHEQRRAEIETQFEAVNNALQEADRLHDEACGPLHAQLLMLNQQVTAATAAERELIRTSTDPEAVAKVKAAHDRYSAEKMRMEKLVAYVNRDLANFIAEADAALRRQMVAPLDLSNPTPHVNSEDHAEYKRLIEKKAETEREIEAIRATLPGLQREEVEASKALLEATAI